MFKPWIFIIILNRFVSGELELVNSYVGAAFLICVSGRGAILIPGKGNFLDLLLIIHHGGTEYTEKIIR